MLAHAQTEQRIVVTIDKDFGELAFRTRLPAQCGVVLIRLDWKDPGSDNRVVVTALTSRKDWAGNFAVIERDRVRIRPLPHFDDDTPESDRKDISAGPHRK